MRSNIDEVDGTCFEIVITNAKQSRLVNKITKMLNKQLTTTQLMEKLKLQLPAEYLRRVSEKRANVPETHTISLLILRRIITVV